MTPPQVLVVEDESIVAWGLRQTLNTLGYVVPGIASSGKAALKMADEHHLDLVIMDIVLRGPMDGIETAIQLRSRFDLPILYLTAYDDDQTLERAKPTEPYGYLVKPFFEQDLRIGVKMALNKHTREKHRIAKTPQRSKRTTTTGHVAADGPVVEAALRLGTARGLSSTELSVLKLLASGFSQTAIANLQQRSLNAVKFHLRNIYRKLHIEGQTDLLRVLF